jgi:uncharacterized protein
LATKKELPWYSEGLAFKCTQCGDCCGGAPGYVWVNNEEIAAIAKSMEMADDIEGFEKKFVRRIGVRKSLVEYSDGDCIFLDSATRKCLVYKARPIQCRTWPFWDSNLRSPKKWEEAAAACPGCNKGKVYSFDDIETRRKEKSV